MTVDCSYIMVMSHYFQHINTLGIESKSFGGKYTNDLFPTNVQLDEYGVHFKLNHTKNTVRCSLTWKT